MRAGDRSREMPDAPCPRRRGRALIVGLLASAWGARHLRGRSIRPLVLGFAGIAGVIAIVNGLT